MRSWKIILERLEIGVFISELETLEMMCSVAKGWLDSAPTELVDEDGEPVPENEQPLGRYAHVYGGVFVTTGNGVAQGGTYGPMIVSPGAVSAGSTGVVGGDSTTGALVIGGSIHGCDVGVSMQGNVAVVGTSLFDNGINVSMSNSECGLIACNLFSADTYSLQIQNFLVPSHYPVSVSLLLQSRYGWWSSLVNQVLYSRILGMTLTLFLLGVDAARAGVISYPIFPDALYRTHISPRAIDEGAAGLRLLNTEFYKPLNELFELEGESARIKGTLVSLGAGSVCDSPLSGTYTMTGPGPLFNLENDNAILRLNNMYVDCAGKGRLVQVGSHGTAVNSCTVRLQNVQVFNPMRNTGSERGGGAIYSHGAPNVVIVDNCKFDGLAYGSSQATLYGTPMEGGFIHAWQTRVIIRNSTFSNARIDNGSANWGYGGGAVHLEDCNANWISHCVFRNCYAHSGGALSFDGATAQVHYSSFVDNQAKLDSSSGWDGGGHVTCFSHVDDSEVLFDHCIFSGGVVGADGTGADAHGGAIQCTAMSDKASVITLSNCTFDGNSAAWGGSAVCASKSGGSLGGDVTVLDSIISGHPQGTTLARLVTGTIEVTYTDFWNNTDGDVAAPITKGDGCFAEDPLYCGA